jgi:4-alpha-glucanotransferase
MVSDWELNRRGLNNNFERLTKPVITRDLVFRLFGNEDGDRVISKFLQPSAKGWDGEFDLKPQFNQECFIVEEIKREMGITDVSTSDELKALDVELKKYYGLTNSVCLYRIGDGYAPRFDVGSTESFRRLGGDWQHAIAQLSKEYFYEWHQPIFEQAARKKFPRIKEASRMLICGEDLGLLTEIIPRVMQDFHILGLRVQRMPADPAESYYHPNTYQNDMVATTSTHDMPPLRAWWQITQLDRPDLRSFYESSDAKKETQIRDCLWFDTLKNPSPRPVSLPCSQLERIVDMHFFSPAMLCVLPYQDLVAIVEDKDVYHQNPWDEVINNPDNRKHYWQYRMPCYLETLMEKTELSERILGKVVESGRLRCH